MKISIITVVFNARDTIEDCVRSVLGQSHPDLEYIVVDGGSTDGTVEIIRRHQARLAAFVSEPDSGIYDAMNKGIKLATGYIIGLLNADDIYQNEKVISTVAEEFASRNVDAVFGDLVYVDSHDPGRIVRYYRSADFHVNKFASGWMPAHPTFFVKRVMYERYGLFKTDYKIAADYELLVRFLYKNNVSYSYIPKVLVRMRTGGISTKGVGSNWILNREIVKACNENGIKTNMLKVLAKYPRKIFELIRKPSQQALS
ncbi:MAG: glycosyl transferase [Deltaproteobacteria bacterium RIFOXYD12_FULL_57_12]|nr:MAG: glycosyl transferase [Deltaproteobacteria bacterium RIFOXYD12_FULL_57_12]